MKNLRTILSEAQGLSDEFEHFADSERIGEISRKIYFRACQVAGLKYSEAKKCLQENYRRAGLQHLF